MNLESVIERLTADGNLRYIPSEAPGLLDFSTNDYLGINEEHALHDNFMADITNRSLHLSSTASRLLASDQRQYSRLEQRLATLYSHGRDALLFNSGYHANTGIVSALADNRTLIIADKLVHASIIDGIILSRARFTRFRHNDMDHLERLVAEAGVEYDTLLVIVESIYSMDGDRADIDRLAYIRRRYPRVMLYVDEAHAVGVLGRQGLGLCADRDDIDIVVGTFGKALASMGAYAIISPVMKQYLLNTARSFIFSTALPPMQTAWTLYVLEHVIDMDDRRAHLAALALQLAEGISNDPTTASHITPYIIGDAARTVALSNQMADNDGIKVLPIRRPTVPPGTERLRISLSAARTATEIDRLINSIKGLA